MLLAVCNECMGQGGWEGPTPVRYPNGESVRRYADCPECKGTGTRPVSAAQVVREGMSDDG